MSAETEPNFPMKESEIKRNRIFVQNLYKDFEQTVISAEGAPQEFNDPLDKTNKIETQSRGLIAIEHELTEIINRLLKLDPENAVIKLLEILNMNKDVIDKDIYNKLMEHIRGK